MDQIIAVGSKPAEDSHVLKFDTVYARNVLEQYHICLWKFNITYWRTPNYNATRLAFSVAVALIFGACFRKLGGKTGNGQQIYNTLGALLTSTLFLGILNSIFLQPVVHAERAVFYRERAAGMYSVAPGTWHWYGPALAVQHAVDERPLVVLSHVSINSMLLPDQQLDVRKSLPVRSSVQTWANKPDANGGAQKICLLVCVCSKLWNSLDSKPVLRYLVLASSSEQLAKHFGLNPAAGHLRLVITSCMNSGSS